MSRRGSCAAVLLALVVVIVVGLLVYCAMQPPPTYCDHGRHAGRCERKTLMLIPVRVGKTTVQQQHWIRCSCATAHGPGNGGGR